MLRVRSCLHLCEKFSLKLKTYISKVNEANLWFQRYDFEKLCPCPPWRKCFLVLNAFFVLFVYHLYWETFSSPTKERPFHVSDIFWICLTWGGIFQNQSQWRFTAVPHWETVMLDWPISCFCCHRCYDSTMFQSSFHFFCNLCWSFNWANVAVLR